MVLAAMYRHILIPETRGNSMNKRTLSALALMHLGFGWMMVPYFYVTTINLLSLLSINSWISYEANAVYIKFIVLFFFVILFFCI